jgi:hypothetical protein
MTTPKGQFRKRRTTTLTGIPKNIKEWFAGERRFTFYAYTPPYAAHLAEYWEAWVQEHPGAVKPDGLENIIKISRRPQAAETIKPEEE